MPLAILNGSEESQQAVREMLRYVQHDSKQKNQEFPGLINP